MKNNLESQLKKLRQVALSEAEKRDMKHSIDGHIRVADVRNAGESRQYRQWSHILAVFNNKKHIMTGLAIGLILLIGGGTSFAAEGALPGDTLYPVKVEVNERVQGALAIGAENEAEFQSARAEERLAEAAQLAAQGRLNAETRKEVSERFNTHVRAALENTEKLDAKQKGDVASRVHSRIESAFSAHAEVLAGIGVNASADARNNVEALVNDVRARGNEAAQARVETESNMEARGEAGMEASANAMQNAAEKKIADLEAKLDASTELDAEVRAKAETSLENAREAFAEGEARLESSDNKAAYQQFVQAFHTANRARVLVNSRLDIFGSLPVGIQNKIDGKANATSTSEQRSERSEERRGMENRSDSAGDGRDNAGESEEESEQRGRSQEDTDNSTAGASINVDVRSDTEVDNGAGTVQTGIEGRGRIQFGF